MQLAIHDDNKQHGGDTIDGECLKTVYKFLPSLEHNTTIKAHGIINMK